MEGLKLCYIGDGNNMANSLIVGGLKVGMQVAVAYARRLSSPMKAFWHFAKDYGDTFFLTERSAGSRHGMPMS